MVNEGNSIGSLAMTYAIDNPNAEVARILSDVAGTNPSAGTYRYYAHDHLGSTRALRAQDKSSLGAYEYTPYGQQYAQSGVAMSALGGSYTGKPWDATAQLYYFPYRYYSPDAARWLTRDPLDMADGPNVYWYVKGNPSTFADALGDSILPDWWPRPGDGKCNPIYLAWKCGKCLLGLVTAPVTCAACLGIAGLAFCGMPVPDPTDLAAIGVCVLCGLQFLAFCLDCGACLDELKDCG